MYSTVKYFNVSCVSSAKHFQPIHLVVSHESGLQVQLKLILLVLTFTKCILKISDHLSVSLTELV